MTPEEHKEIADRIFNDDAGDTREAIFHVQMGILEAFLQMEICGHGTRGFCIDCFWTRFQQNSPIVTKPWR